MSNALVPQRHGSAIEAHEAARRSLYDPHADRDRKMLPFGTKAYLFAHRKPENDKRINILTGAVRSAKTWAMIPKLIELLRYKVSGTRIITGASKVSIYQNVLNDLFDIIGPANYTYSRMSGELTLFGQHWRVIGAKDEGSEKYIRGSTIGIAYCDELSLMPQSFFNMLLSRMSPAGARLYATTNPDSPYHWLKKEVIDNKEMAAILWTQHFTLFDNPNLTEEYRADVKRMYTGVFYSRFILGLWVLAAGAIYRDVLAEDLFYTDAQRPPALRGRGGHITHYVAIDAGTVNACVFIDLYDDGYRIWADREYYWDSREQRLQKTNGQYADDLIQFVGGYGPNGDTREWPGIIIDPSAASLKVELIQRGFFILDANNEVEEGLSKVSTMLSLKKLRINRSCTNGIREMMTYSWNEKKAEAGIEEPLKEHDHWPDALRYYIQTLIDNYRLTVIAP